LETAFLLSSERRILCRYQFAAYWSIDDGAQIIKSMAAVMSEESRRIEETSMVDLGFIGVTRFLENIC
jgi:hypothetical protein